MLNILVQRADAMVDATLVLVICFCSIAIYNILELLFIVPATFKKRNNLYFWTFLVAMLGISLFSIGYLIQSLKTEFLHDILNTILILLGWCLMVTGQSVVLYSRLHLVMESHLVLRLALVLIITNAIILHTPRIVLVAGINSSNPDPFLKIYFIYQKLQVSAFCLQEITLSSLYVYAALRSLRPDAKVRDGTSKRTMTDLMYINVVLIFLDITIVVMEFSGLYMIQMAYRALIYSIKLKIEFHILNKLIEPTQDDRSGNRSNIYADAEDSFSSAWIPNYERLRRGSRILAQQFMGYSAFISGGGKQARKAQETCAESTIVVSRTVVAMHSEAASIADGNKDLGVKVTEVWEGV